MSEMLETADRMFLMASGTSLADKTRMVADCVKGASTAWGFIVAGELMLWCKGNGRLQLTGIRGVVAGRECLSLVRAGARGRFRDLATRIASMLMAFKTFYLLQSTTQYVMDIKDH